MALTDAEILAMGFALPVGTDLISQGDNVISQNARAAAEAIKAAAFKKGTIPNGVDVREFMYGKANTGQWESPLSITNIATLTGLPQRLMDDPAAFTATTETWGNGTVIKLTVYSVYYVAEYICTSAPSTGDGWTRWYEKQYAIEGSEEEAVLAGARSSGFKTLPLILTAGHGGTSYAPATGNAEYDVNLAQSIYVSRFRFAIRDGNPRWGVFTGQAIQLSNVSVAGVTKLSSMTTKSDGSITFSPWMTGKLGNLKFDYNAPIAPRLNVGGGKLDGVRKTMMPFELWIEVETPVSTPAIGLIGDSNSVAVNTTIPVHDSWLQIYGRRMGIFPVLYGHSGWAMNSSTDPNMYTWNRWNHLDTPDMVIHGNVANDLPSTEGGVTLAELQDRAYKEIALADEKVSKNHHFILLKSRASGTNNTVRVQWNNWIKSLPDPIRDFQDIAAPVTTNDTGGLRPEFISSDGLHMNTAGQTAIADSLNKVMTVRSSLVFDETAGRTVKAWDYLNQREQLIYGDTGWRDVSSWLRTDRGYTVRLIQVRRVGGTVHIRFADATGGTGTFFTPSAGFRVGATTDLFWASAVSTAGEVKQLRGNNYGFIVDGVAVSDVFNCYAIYETSDPWPATLPGVAA